MTGVDRRTLVRTALLAAAGGAIPLRDEAHSMTDIPAAWRGSEQIAMLVYPGMTALDLIGPQHFFSSLMGATVRLVGKSAEPVRSDTGVIITPTATFESCPRDLAILFAPGGTVGTLAAMRDPATRAFMADRGARAGWVTSVCTGSLILAASGLLAGYRATSHWAARASLADFGAIPTEGRVVEDRNRITGAGVTAGLDFGLSMVARLRDATYAQAVQLQAEYDPQPPFTAGSPATAPREVRAIVEPMLAPFADQARAVARELRP
jgi:transcriptional regulator GlxA family with amidase domain